MSLIKKDCPEYKDTRKICVASEKGKTYRLENDSGLIIRKLSVEKCVARGIGEERCDYLVDVYKPEAEREILIKAIFIELKGGALVKAVNQLYSSIRFLEKEFKGGQIDARIVGSRDVPGIMNFPEYRKLAKLVNSHKGILARSTNNIYIETI